MSAHDLFFVNGLSDHDVDFCPRNSDETMPRLHPKNSEEVPCSVAQHRRRTGFAMDSGQIAIDPSIARYFGKLTRESMLTIPRIVNKTQAAGSVERE